MAIWRTWKAGWLAKIVLKEMWSRFPEPFKPGFANSSIGELVLPACLKKKPKKPGWSM